MRRFVHNWLLRKTPGRAGGCSACLVLALVSGVRAVGAPSRPDIATAKPIAACKLQVIASKRAPANETPPVLFYGQPPAEDPLTNYERTPLGDWRMAADAERNDPWLRLVLLSRKRPVVIDLAVLVEGKSFRDKRDAWIDELVTSSGKGPQPTAESPAAKKGNNKSAATGTEPVATASASASPKTIKVSAEKAKPAAVPTVHAQSRQAPTMRARLADYLATNHAQVDRKEIQWLIAAWGAGPGVVLLDPSHSWQRSARAPLETYLDRNGDGVFSREEIAEADAMLRKADVDSNDVVDLSEIRRLVDRPAAAPAVGGYSLVVVLDANTDWQSLEDNHGQALWESSFRCGRVASAPGRYHAAGKL